MQDDNDRRAGQERVPFEALVAVDGDAKAGGYECEAMDVSQTGMHLRTAYLPEIGQELMLRFDAGTGEVAVKGLVVWREEQARGGEFGLEFTALDDQSLASLRELCGLPEEGAAEGDAKAAQDDKAQTSRGSRVRLHIEGLGSPMRARVKDAEGSAVMVGSNLDFLRVGRELELENMDHGEKRAAFIDRVEVEIDPESKIPQLVVTLKYDANEAGKGPAMRSSSANLGSAPAAGDDAGHDESEGENEHDEGPGALDGLRGKASSLAAQIGPAMSSFGLRAKTAMASAIATIKNRGQNTADEDGEDGPKVTADAPGGGLSSSGRRAELLDESDELEADGEEHAARVEADGEKAKKRKLMVAGGAALAVLVALVLTLSGGKKKTEGEAEAAAAASASAEMAALPAPGGVGANASPNTLTRPTLPPGADAVTAAVPLFGSTPLSTTEAAALPAPIASGGPAIAVPGAAVAAAPAPEPAEEKEPKDVGEATFGKGTVKNAKVVKLKMDAPIEGLKGAVAGKTLTITLPGRHNVEAASTLAKKDKRISSSKAVATSDGVDVSLTFKDSVPPFLAKTDGKTLAIELGESKSGGAVAENDDDDDAKPSKKKSKKHATAKKGEKDKHGKDKDKKKKSKTKKAHLASWVVSPKTARSREGTRRFAVVAGCPETARSREEARRFPVEKRTDGGRTQTRPFRSRASRAQRDQASAVRAEVPALPTTAANLCPWGERALGPGVRGRAN